MWAWTPCDVEKIVVTSNFRLPTRARTRPFAKSQRFAKRELRNAAARRLFRSVLFLLPGNFTEKIMNGTPIVPASEKNNNNNKNKNKKKPLASLSSFVLNASVWGRPAQTARNPGHVTVY